MNDDELVAGLQRLFDADDPSDGIDRSDGYGEDYRFTALQVVTAPDGFDDLDVTVEVGQRTVTARLLFDREWRQESGLDEVGAYAAYVVAKWRQLLVDADDHPSILRQGGPDAAWDELSAWLARRWGPVTEIDDGLRLVDDGEEVTVHVTREQWATFAATRPDPHGELDEMIGSRWDDEHHVVHFRGGFHRSIRAELPPVRSMLLRDPSDREG